MKREQRVALALAATLILLAPAVLSREPRRDASSSRIRLKYIGDCLAAQTPTGGIGQDPLISLVLVPASDQEWAADWNQITRSMRLYMPRTLDDLLENTDVVMLSNAATYYFRSDWIQWLATGAREGIGLQMVGGYCSFGGHGYPDWGPTSVGSILPVETMPANAKRDFPFRLVPAIDDDPLLSIFDWKRGPIFYAVNNVRMRQGGKLLAVTEPENRPLLAYQEVGEGSVLAFMSTWGLPWGDDFVRWEYFIDFSADMVYYSAGLKIPDPTVVHQIRVLFEKYDLNRVVLRSLLDFIDSIGGAAGKVHESLSNLELEKGRAEQLYREQDYQGCLEGISTLVEDIAALDEAAVKAKDAAFLWIYVTEWSAVTATGIVSGYFLFLVMVRRRLLKQVASTKSTRG